jgi:signal recognition particle subunit SRP54
MGGQMKDMGSLQDIAGMLPGMGGQMKNLQIDARQMARTEAIILSMTPRERDNPDVINYSRKKRIAAGCGLRIEDVNRLLKQFEQMRKLMRQLSGPNLKKMQRKGFNLPGFPG